MTTIEPGFLTICTYSGFSPVCAKRPHETNPWGKDISYLTQFAAAHSLTPKWKVLDAFEGIWFQPGKGTCDMAAAGITATEDRMSDAGAGTLWTKPYFQVERSFLIRKCDSERFRTITDFGGKTVAVTQGSTADMDIQVRNESHATVVFRSDQQVALDDLLLSRNIDAFGEGDVSNDYLATTRPGLVVIDRHRYNGEPEPLTFPVRAASGIFDLLNAWIEEKGDDYYRNIPI